MLIMVHTHLGNPTLERPQYKRWTTGSAIARLFSIKEGEGDERLSFEAGYEACEMMVTRAHCMHQGMDTAH